VLQRVLPVIASVRVATGSAQTLHSLPVAASALDRTAIASSTAIASDALLRKLPGFDRTRSNSMFSNYGLLRVSFAGAGSDRGLVLVDGVPAQDGFGGQIDWAAYPPQSLTRAELLLGAGSALYGAGAVGGALDLQSFAPPTAPGLPSGDVTYGAGTHGYSLQASNARAWIAPHLSAAASLQQQRLEYWDLPPAYQSPIDREAQSDAAMASLRLRYEAGAHDTFELGQRAAWDDQFEGRTNYTFTRRQQQSDMRYAHTTAQSFVSATLFSRTAFIVNVADRFPTSPGVLRYTQYVPTNEDGVSTMWIAGGGPSTFELRADARHVRGQTQQFGQNSVFQNAGSGSQNLYGFAAQQTWRTPRFELVAGARYDTLTSYDEQLVSAAGIRSPASRSDAAVSPRVALRYDFSPRLAVRASSGAGFRPPFLNELVRGYFIGNVAYQPNPFLVPERSATNSAGIDYAVSGSRIALDAFDTSVSDAIMFRTIDPTHQMRSNVAHTKTNGYTLSYTQALGTCSRVTTSFTDQYARVTSGADEIIGKRLQYVPQQSGSIDYAGGIGRVGVGFSLTYLGQTFADDLNVQPLGTALVAGARVRIPFANGAAVSISAENLTGARYLSSIDRYGLPAVLSVNFSLPVRATTADQGNCQRM
jgi:outer membrane receptor protein involved in Fe transport